MKNWITSMWEKVKEVPVKTVAIGGGVLIGGAALTWLLTGILRKAFGRK